jgi:phenylalanyl-tRNA synthetase beta chain
MKVPYSWLAQWVDVPWDARELGARLTMSGFELDALEPAAPPFSGVIVAEIVSAERHPQADKLQVCKVSTGSGDPVQIVCGASNARAGLKSALATVGAELPGGLRIKAAKLRGVESFGMLASAKELGLAEVSGGILELPADAPVGMTVRQYLQLDDEVLDLAVTPNRGDAMSVLGVAREVAALAGIRVRSAEQVQLPGASAEASVGAGSPQLAARAAAAEQRDRVGVFLDAPAACPAFAGCVVRGVDNRRSTPVWLRERLRRAGVRSISPVVDVTNFVMLELGQPMHAYDLHKLEGDIRVRLGRPGEPIRLLDGRAIEVQDDVLLITDGAGPVGVAGIMGGERTAASAETVDIFLEAAFFSPQAIAGRARRWGLITDAGQRFERGVDPAQQRRAMERAVALVRLIGGGEPGPIQLAQSASHLPARKAVRVRRSQIRRLLGAEIADERISEVWTALQMTVAPAEGGWEVTPPSHRFDVNIEADLIEEVARIVGYNTIAERPADSKHHFRNLPEALPGEHVLLEALAMRGYEEAITFAFVDPVLQGKLFPGQQGLVLANAIASDLSVMRLSLWPGLVKVALENQRRQQDRIRLFEHGARFLVGGAGETRELDALAGIAAGSRLPEQWGAARASVDFYDVKGDIEALIAGTGESEAFVFEAPATPLSCLHPGRAARILRNGQEAGWLGELHPSLVRELGFTQTPVLFELDIGALQIQRPHYREVSRFPQVRRDLALVVDEAVALSALAERVTLSASSLLSELRIFDVYRGPGVEAGRKSVALGLIFQDISRTLTDDDVERLMAAIASDLQASLDAKIRE